MDDGCRVPFREVVNPIYYWVDTAAIIIIMKMIIRIMIFMIKQYIIGNLIQLHKDCDISVVRLKLAPKIFGCRAITNEFHMRH